MLAALLCLAAARPKRIRPAPTYLRLVLFSSSRLTRDGGCPLHSEIASVACKKKDYILLRNRANY